MKRPNMRVFYCVAAVLGLVAIALGGYALQSHASQTASQASIQAATKSVNSFFNAYLTGDYNKAIDNSVDVNGRNVDRETRYNEYARSKGTSQELKGYQILSAKAINRNLIAVTVKLELANSTVIEEYPIINQSGTWVVDISRGTPVTTKGVN